MSDTTEEELSLAPTPIDEALSQPITLSLDESDVGLVAELLMGRDRGERPTKATAAAKKKLEGAEPTPSQRLAVARVLATGCLRFLLHGGGARERTVLRGPLDARRRERGRLFDAGLNVDFAPRFSPMAFDAVWHLATVVAPLSAHREETREFTPQRTLSREETRQLGRARVSPALLPLDHVFCVVALEHLGLLRLSDAVHAFVAESFVRASPLAALFCADEAVADDDADALVAADVVRVVEVCGDAIAAALINRAKIIWRRSVHADELVQRCENFARTVRNHLRALDVAQRLDLIEPVARAVAALPTLWPSDARARLVRLPGVTTMADRDRVVAACADVVGLGVDLDALRGRLHAARYGDERYDEAQIGLRALDDLWLPGRDAVAAFARALTGAVG